MKAKVTITGWVKTVGMMFKHRMKGMYHYKLLLCVMKI